MNSKIEIPDTETSGGSKGGPGTHGPPLDPISFIFMLFRQRMSNNSLAHSETPGCATVNIQHPNLAESNRSSQWRIQDSPKGAPTPRVGVLTYYFANFLDSVGIRQWFPLVRKTTNSNQNTKNISRDKKTGEKVRDHTYLNTCLPKS